MCIPRWKKRQHILRRNMHPHLHRAHKYTHFAYLGSVLSEAHSMHLCAVGLLLAVALVSWALADEVGA